MYSPVSFYQSLDGLIMKTFAKNQLTEIFSNSINRNLILILLAAMIVATFLVTASIMLYNQL